MLRRRSEELLPNVSIPLTDGLGGNFIGSASFTRATSATYVDDSGIVQEVGNNVSRHTSKGVLIEGASTNLLTHSADYSNAAWSSSTNGTGSAHVVTSNFATAPNGELEADRIVFNSGAGTTSNDWSICAQALTFAGNESRAEIWMRGDVGGEEIVIRVNEAGAYTKLTLTAEWVRYEDTVNDSATGNSFNFGVRQGLGGIGTINSNPTIYVWNAQAENGTILSSDIESGASATQRNAENLSYPAAGNVDADEMTVHVEFEPNQVGSDAVIWEINDGSANNRITLFMRSTGVFRCNVISGGVSQSAAESTSAGVVGVRSKLVLTLKDDDLKLYVDGTQEASDSSVTLPVTRTNLDLGQDFSGAGQPFAYIRNFDFYDRVSTATEVAAL